MNKRLLVLAVAITLAYPCAQAQADHAIDTVVVSGSRAQSWLSETPQAIGVVNAALLERDKPKTMGDILNRIAGVYWNDLGNEQHSMSIRQPIGTNAVYQYLEDGIPIRPLGVFNHNSLNEMNMAGASGVEVVKGAASSLYGSNAVGGAVNFLSAGASATPTAKVDIRRDNVAGFSRYDTSASDTWGPLGLRFSHYSSRRSRDNWQEYSYGDKDSFSLRADYALSPTSQLRATLVHMDLDAAMTGSLFENDYRNAPGKSLNTFTYRKDKTTRMNLAWEGETTVNGTSTVTVFTRKNDHGQIPAYSIGSCVGTLCKGVINNNHVDSLGLDVKHQQEFTWLRSRLVAGVYVDKSDNPFVSDNLSIVRDAATGRYLRYTLANAVNPQGVRDYQTDILNTAVFAQWEFSPLAGTRVVLGARSDAIRYDYHNKLAPGGSVNYGAPDESRSFSHLSPKLGGTYALGHAGSAYANVSQGFTPPEVSQLYGKTGIADLQPSVYNNYELGLRWAFLQGRLKLDTAVYRLDGRDTIVSYTLSPGNSENRNAGRTRSEGLELGLNYDSGPFDARFATAIARHRYLRYQVSASLDYSGRSMPQAPRDITSVEIGYKPLAGARVALEAVHQGRYWMNNANTVQYKGHALLNLRASYQLARGLEAWAQVRNLMDKRYADSASSSYSGVGSYAPNSQNQYTPGAPRSVMLGLGYTFNAL
ncbi:MULTISPECIES: TonB-dependent receptor [unclassified Janthinobacterium]|uniref:TonB-dependent receptor family protein n=1 Tax=unclassified Janthinobacterium TaxID=2610881 RepID=UPI001A1BC482|nr:TonB-dependent receptor [Janthinobacterium sp. CG_23.4]MDH6156575.1 outer membrane receptor protein involved in Fe transport [Janthinobacterium sp. CG_23.4]